MSENKNSNISVYDGGTAFPIDENCSTPGCDGMSLRDYFAAKAMLSLTEPTDASVFFKTTARMSYELADAMLKERSK